METLIDPDRPGPPAASTVKQRFEALLADNHRIVLKVAALYASSRDDRLDLAQEIRVQLWRAFPSFDGQRKFSTWMYRVALNVAISQLRHDVGVRTRFEPIGDDAEDLAAPESSEPDARLALLDDFIASLEPMNRALMLLVLDERSHAEIADVLGLSVSNVATKINRIKTRLRERFDAAAHSQET